MDRYKTKWLTINKSLNNGRFLCIIEEILFLNLKVPKKQQQKYEPRHEKTNILHMRKTKMQISFAVTAKLISAFNFAK